MRLSWPVPQPNAPGSCGNSRSDNQAQPPSSFFDTTGLAKLEAEAAATTVLENHCDNAFAPAHRFAPSRAKTVRRRSTPAGKPGTAASSLVGGANDQARPAAEHGRRGFRLVLGKEAWRPYLDRQRQ